MNPKKLLAAAFLSTFAAVALGEGTTPPTDAPPKGTAGAKKVADKDDAKKRVEVKDDGKKDGDKDDAKKDGKKDHRKHHDHKKHEG